MTAPTNPDLPLSWMEPGVYTYVNFTGSGAAVDDATRRVLLLGYMGASGSYAPNTPVLLTQQSDANSYFQRKSDLSRIFAAFNSQDGPGTSEVWCCGITPPSAGTAATYTVTFAGPATATGSGTFYCCGYPASVSIGASDTATTVATALFGQLALLTDLPGTWTDGGSGTLTFTYLHKGLTGNDCPMRWDQTDGTGITASPGIVTYASAATGAGSTTITVGATTYTQAIGNGDTAAAVATAMIATINAAGGPVTAVTGGSGVVTLIYNKEHHVRRISAAIITSTVITATVTLHGTSGATSPSIATAITNIENMSKGFAAIVSGFTDATAVDLLYDSVLVQANGINQKDPLVFLATPGSLTTAAAVVTDPAPDLTATPYFTVAWCREAGQQALELGARYAAAYVKSDFAPQNLDGQALKTRSGIPLLAPALSDQPNAADRQTAMRTSYLTPLTVNSRGELVILRAVTTSNAANQDLHEVSTIRQVAIARPKLNQRLISLFSGKSYRTSTPKTPNTVTPTSVKDASYVWIREQDDQDLFDNAPAWKDAIACNVDSVVNTRFNLYVPFAIIRNLHQIGSVMSPV